MSLASVVRVCLRRLGYTRMMDDQEPKIDPDTPSPSTTAHRDQIPATAQRNDTRDGKPHDLSVCLWRGMSGAEALHELVNHPTRDDYVLAGRPAQPLRPVQPSVSMPLW